MRLKSKRDDNEAEIVKALEAFGATVERISMGGIGDLLIGAHGMNYILEVKSATGKLTPEQKAWHSAWKGQKAIVRTAEAALGVIQARVPKNGVYGATEHMSVAEYKECLLRERAVIK